MGKANFQGADSSRTKSHPTRGKAFMKCSPSTF